MEQYPNSKQGASVITAITTLMFIALLGSGLYWYITHKNPDSSPDAAQAPLPSPRPLQTPSPDAAATSLVSRSTGMSTNMATLQATGVITLPDGSKRALLNGSYVEVGSFIYGYQIMSIKENEIQLSIDAGSPISIPLYEKCEVPLPVSSDELILEKICQRNGHWTAVFQGNSYRVGDWVTPETKIHVITPTLVQVQHRGEQITFRLSQ